jgi:hypothetical protein
VVLASDAVLDQGLADLPELLHFLDLLVPLCDTIHQHGLLSSSFYYLAFLSLVSDKLLSIGLFVPIDHLLVLILFVTLGSLLYLSLEFFINSLPFFLISLLFGFSPTFFLHFFSSLFNLLCEFGSGLSKDVYI